MVAAYGTLSRQGPLARANAAAARRWGTAFLLISTGLLALQLVVGAIRLAQPVAPTAALLPAGIPIILYIAVCVVHLVVVAVALGRARRGEPVAARARAS